MRAAVMAAVRQGHPLAIRYSRMSAKRPRPARHTEHLSSWRHQQNLPSDETPPNLGSCQLHARKRESHEKLVARNTSQLLLQPSLTGREQ